MAKRIKIVVIILASVFIAAVILIVILIGVIISSNISSSRGDFELLTKQFTLVFNDLNSRSDNTFSYTNAFFLDDHIPTYVLKYLGEDDFVNSCTKFQNDFAAIIKNGDYTPIRPEDCYIIKISAPKGFVTFWYERGSVKTETNVYGDYSVFENLDGIQDLIILSRSFTAEQSEYVNSLKDDFSFELYISDGTPWF